jgi:ABC-type nitrate/sulfonate/bicarbonate transport system substrate-binding protein
MAADVSVERCACHTRQARNGFKALLLIGALLVAAFGQSPSHAAGPLKWKHGIVVAKGDAGFVLMAQAKNFFTAHGVSVEYVSFVGNIQLNQALIARQIDSGESAPDPAFAAVLKGIDVKIIGATIPGNPFAVYTRREITSFAQLAGKSIGASAPGSFPDILMRAVVQARGVDPKSLVVVNAGSDAERYQAVKGGKVDAAVLSSEFVPQAREDGINVLGFVKDIVPQFPRFVIIANGISLREKPEAAVGFLAGEMEGLSYALTHREEALALTAKTIRVSPDNPRITYLYDELKHGHMVTPTLAIPRDKIEWLQGFRIRLGLQKQRVDLDTLLDDSYRQKALAVAKNVLR